MYLYIPIRSSYQSAFHLSLEELTLFSIKDFPLGHLIIPLSYSNVWIAHEGFCNEIIKLSCFWLQFLHPLHFWKIIIIDYVLKVSSTYDICKLNVYSHSNLSGSNASSSMWRSSRPLKSPCATRDANDTASVDRTYCLPWKCFSRSTRMGAHWIPCEMSELTVLLYQSKPKARICSFLSQSWK